MGICVFVSPSLFIASMLFLGGSCLAAWLSDMSLAQLALDYVDRHMTPLGPGVCEARSESLRLAAKEENNFKFTSENLRLNCATFDVHWNATSDEDVQTGWIYTHLFSPSSWTTTRSMYMPLVLLQSLKPPTGTNISQSTVSLA